MNLEKASQLPDSLLKDIPGDESRSPGLDNLPGASAPYSPVSVVSIDEVKEAGKTAETFINEPLNTSQPANSTTARPVQIGGLVSGKFATDLMDTLLPSLIVALVSAIGYKFDKKGLQLSQKEKDIIAPAMQDYLNSINVNTNNPFNNLLLVIGVVYGSKVIEVLPTLERNAPKQKPVTKEAVVKQAEEIKEQKARTESEARDKAKFIQSLKAVDRNSALAIIKKQRRKSDQDALQWYNKNVK